MHFKKNWKRSKQETLLWLGFLLILSNRTGVGCNYLRIKVELKELPIRLLPTKNKSIATNYDVLAGDYFYDENDMLQAQGELIAYRRLFLIDKEGIVRHQIVNDLPLGRNVDEALRMVYALQYVEANGIICPANWNKSKEAMVETHEGVAEFLEKHMN